MRVFPPLIPETVCMSALYSTAGLIHASLKGFSTCLKTNEGAQVSAALDFSAACNLIRCVMKEEMLQIADQSYCARGTYYPKSKMVFDIRYFPQKEMIVVSPHVSQVPYYNFFILLFWVSVRKCPSPTDKKKMHFSHTIYCCSISLHPPSLKAYSDWSALTGLRRLQPLCISSVTTVVLGAWLTAYWRHHNLV